MAQQYPVTRPASMPDVPIKIESQVETTELDPMNKPVRGVRVTFSLPSGTTASVFVPSATYTTASVMAAISQYAAHLSAVDKIGH